MFEYSIRPFDYHYFSEVEDYFNRMGASRWEVVQFTQAEPVYGYTGSIWVVFKRLKED